MEFFLTLAGGIFWSAAYAELIRKGIKDKACGMPLFALGLNFAWEIIYSIDGFLYNSFGNVQAWINLAWVLLDAVIVALYFKFGKEEFPKYLRRFFVPYSVLVFVSCFVMQLAFYFCNNVRYAAGITSFGQNAAMSAMFLTMTANRRNTRGQSMTMAVCKCIGTAAMTLQFGIVTELDIYIILMGILCCVFDILHILLLRNISRAETE